MIEYKIKMTSLWNSIGLMKGSLASKRDSLKTEILRPLENKQHISLLKQYYYRKTE